MYSSTHTDGLAVEVNGHVHVSATLVLHLLLFVPQSLIHNTETVVSQQVMSPEL